MPRMLLCLSSLVLALPLAAWAADPVPFAASSTLNVQTKGNVQLLADDSEQLQLGDACAAKIHRKHHRIDLALEVAEGQFCTIKVPRNTNVNVHSERGNVQLWNIDGAHDINIDRGEALVELSNPELFGPAKYYLEHGAFDVLDEHSSGKKISSEWSRPGAYRLSVKVNTGSLVVLRAEATPRKPSTEIPTGNERSRFCLFCKDKSK